MERPDRDETRRFVVVINTHPDKRLSPNASASASRGAKTMRSRVIRDARESGVAAAAYAAMYSPRTLGILDWMTGPVNVALHIEWGIGQSIKDDDNAQGQCKALRDGIADYFGASDRKWHSQRPTQKKHKDNPVFGRTTFTFTPREDA